MNTIFTHSCPCPSWSLWVCVLFSEMRLKLLTDSCFHLLTLWSMGTQTRYQHFFWVFLSVCPLRRSISTVDRFFFVWTDRHGRYRPISGYYEPNRPSISTVILSRCNRTDRRYRPWPTVRSVKANRPNRRHLWNVWSSKSSVPTASEPKPREGVGEGATDILQAESCEEDPRAPGGLVSSSPSGQ